jgi:hypothetical protein
LLAKTPTRAVLDYLLVKTPTRAVKVLGQPQNTNKSCAQKLKNDSGDEG